MLREAMEYNIDVLTFEPRPRPWHAGWCRLDPVIGPSVDATSWIGGLPEMPEDVAWPEVDGRPSVFLAQIAMKDLSPNVWDGTGPKDGWLLFFIEPRRYRDVRVLHILERGPVRNYPSTSAIDEVVPYDTTRALAVLGRDTSQFVPLKFALDVLPLAPDSEEPPDSYAKEKVDPNLRNALLSRDILAAPFRPESPEHTIAMVSALELVLKGQQTSRFGPQPGTPEGDARAAQFETALAEVERLKEDAGKGMAPEALLEEIDRIEDGLATFRSWTFNYKSAVELLARETFQKDPAALSQDARSAFEPVWRFDAEYEAASVSGAVSRGYTYTVVEEPVLLLQLPPSKLIGWMLGDLDTFGIFIQAEDLKARCWDKAWGDIIN